MPDEMEQDSAQTVVEATNKGLSEFLTEKVEGYQAGNTETNNEVLDDGKEKPPETDKTSDSENESDATAAEKAKVEAEEKAKADKEKAEGETDGKEKVDEKANQEPEPGKPVPYDRFKEVLDRRTAVEQDLKLAQPKVENFDRISRFCQENQIQPDQFEKAMRVQALLNTNPAEALKELLPIVESLQGFVGDKLPKDIQDKVDAGKMDLTDGKEMAQLRAQATFREAMSKRSTETTAAQRQQQEMQEYTRNASEWELKQRETDPDYKPKGSENATDGLWEDVRDKYQALLTTTDMRGVPINPVRNPQDMVALMNKAYKSCKDKWTQGIRRDPSRKSLPKNGQARPEVKGTVETATSMHDAVQIRLAERQR